MLACIYGLILLQQLNPSWRVSLHGRDNNPLRIYSDVSAIRSMAEYPSELSGRGSQSRTGECSTKECSYNVTWIRKRIEILTIDDCAICSTAKKRY